MTEEPDSIMYKDEVGWQTKFKKEEFQFGGKGNVIAICTMFDDWEKTRDKIIRNEEIVMKAYEMLKKEEDDKAHDYGYGEYSDTLISSLKDLLNKK